MESIQEPKSSFKFSNLILTPPTNTSGGNHFMKFRMSPEIEGVSGSPSTSGGLQNDNSLYIQTPKCKIKQIVAKTQNKRSFLDLTFTNENEEFVQWVENLETHCHKFIYSKRELWFDSTLEESDIENLFTSILKPMKMGKFYLLRTNTPLITTSLKIYDENENLMNLEDLKEDANIICILEFNGIKCSARGFQVEIEIKQILVLNPINIFDKCILSKKQKTSERFLAEEPSSGERFLAEEPSSGERLLVEEPSSGEKRMDVSGQSMDTLCSAGTNPLLSEPSLDASHLSPTHEMLTEASLLPHSYGCVSVVDAPSSRLIKDELIKSGSGESDNLLEIDFNLETVPIEDSIVLKQRNDVYYEMYKEALKKAKMAKDLALSSYLEAKRIKNLYMLDDLSDDSELEDYVKEDE